MAQRLFDHAVSIESVRATAHTVPTASADADSSLAWKEATIVIARARAGGLEGIGYTYSHPAAADLINGKLAATVLGMDVMDIPPIWDRMAAATLSLGRPGVTSSAIAAVDTALWDLKAKLLGLPLASLLGVPRTEIPLYASGGFTSYTDTHLAEQLGGWAEQGFGMVKMRVGSDPEADPERVRIAREAIGSDVQLLVDGNGAYERKQALVLADVFADYDVRWFEEPLSPDDLEGMRLLRNRIPAGMEIAAGAYGFRLNYFRRLLAAEAVDEVQADASRCAGFTEFMRIGALCVAHQVPLSAHGAPSLHLHPCLALGDVRHIEYFHDHVCIEQLLFDGAARAENGVLRPDLNRPGLGLELKEDVARRYQV